MYILVTISFLNLLPVSIILIANIVKLQIKMQTHEKNYRSF